MVGWFKGKPAEPRDWANLQAEMQGGMPLFARIRTSLADRRVQAKYGHEIAVVLHMLESDETGMPTSGEELDALDALEDRFKDRLEQGGTAVLALVVTTEGTRTLYFYSADPQPAIRAWERELQPTIRDRRVTFDIQPDAAWEAYRCFER
jgi:hypothetical protein